MELKLTYATNYKFDNNMDIVWAQHNIDLNQDEEKYYLQALKDGVEFSEAVGLQDLYQLVIKQIEGMEESNYLDYEAMVATIEMGAARMDPLTLNNLVDKRDPFTLGFFGLTNKSNKELEEWDALEIPEDELPFMSDFTPHVKFEKPSYPEWKITVCFAAPDEEVVKLILRELFQENEDEYTPIYEFIDNMVQMNTECDYSLEDVVQEVVEELGIEGFEF